MSYANDDLAAAVTDLIAFDGDMIEIDGIKHRAKIDRGAGSYEASEFGLDNREQTLTAVIVNRGTIPTFKSPVKYRHQPYRITSIEPSGESVLTLTLTND